MRLLIFSLYSLLVFTPAITKAQPPITETEILTYINQYRTLHHLPNLKLQAYISKIAKQHSADMALHKIPFGHQNFNLRIKTIYKRIKTPKGGAENVAYYKTKAKALVAAWIASPGHRRNILGNYNLTGIGISYAKPGWAYYTQIFIKA